MSDSDRRQSGGKARIVAIVAATVLGAGIVLAVWSLIHDSSATEATPNGGPAVTTVHLRDFAFVPRTIRVRGLTATIVLRDEGIHSHTFTSDGLDVDVAVESGTTRTIRVTAPAAGEYDFVCRFHQNLGMQGRIRFGG
jgi:plastocyanin